jgi:hypothetical protein
VTINFHSVIDEVENVLEVIEQYPSSGTKITPTERGSLVSRFPYGIVYTVEGEVILSRYLRS